MTPFTYARARDRPDALRLGAAQRSAYLGGGTNLIDLMRENVAHPGSLVDVARLPAAIEQTPAGGLLIGAATSNASLAEHPIVRERYPLLARAILAGASPQIRNRATVGGNILQRTRCSYFYDQAFRCNKREPGQGCDAIDGLNRIHAILGASPSCVATHASDMCVALAALDAVVHVEGGADGPRSLPFADVHRLPGDDPSRDTNLRAGDLIVAVELPATAAATRSTYRKVRDRASYAFALVSVAAKLTLEDGRLAGIGIAFGGVAHKPWRALKAERLLRDSAPSTQGFRAAVDAEFVDAEPLRDNGFKIELAKAIAVATLVELTEQLP